MAVPLAEIPLVLVERMAQAPPKFLHVSAEFGASMIGRDAHEALWLVITFNLITLFKESV
jgi:hypothetical protein